MSIIKKPSFLALFILLLAFQFGCQRQQAIKHAQKQIKIVSLSPSTTELIALYADPKVLAGRTQSCNYPEWVKKVPIVVSLKPNYELLAKIAPTHIIYDSTLFSQHDILKLQEVGATLISVEPKKLDKLFLTLTKIEDELAPAFNVKNYLQKLKQSIKEALSKPLEDRPKVAILSEDGLYREYYMAGTKTIQADLLNTLGCEVVGPSSSKFEKISIESLVAYNPELIFTIEKPMAITQDPRLKTVQAVRNCQVYQIQADLLSRIGARVDQLIHVFHAHLQGFARSGLCKKQTHSR